MLLNNKSYVSDLSDLKITILKVQYKTKEYCKVKAILTNKRNGIFYEIASYKLYFDKIKHWKLENV